MFPSLVRRVLPPAGALRVRERYDPTLLATPSFKAEAVGILSLVSENVESPVVDQRLAVLGLIHRQGGDPGAQVEPTDLRASHPGFGHQSDGPPGHQKAAFRTGPARCGGVGHRPRESSPAHLAMWGGTPRKANPGGAAGAPEHSERGAGGVNPHSVPFACPAQGPLEDRTAIRTDPREFEPRGGRPPDTRGEHSPRPRQGTGRIRGLGRAGPNTGPESGYGPTSGESCRRKSTT